MPQKVAYIYVDPFLESAPDASFWAADIEHIYSDFGDRAALGELRQSIQSGLVHTLVIRKISEIGDSCVEISKILSELQKTGVSLQILDQNNPLSLADATIAQVLELFDHVTSDHQQRRLQHGHAKNRLAALPPPGRAPFGYRRGKDRYAIDRAAAGIIKDFFENFLLYGSLRGAVRFVEQKHHKKISVSTGRNWLTNPVYRGDLAYKTGDIILNTHPALVSREEAAQVDRLLRRNRTLSPKTASAARSLAGLVQCDQCQSKMTITSTRSRHTKNAGYLYLRPSACGRVANPGHACPLVHYDEILEQVIQRICHDLPQRVSQTKLPNVEQIKNQFQQQIHEQENLLLEITDLCDRGIFDPTTAQMRSYQIRVQMGVLQNKLSQLPPASLSMISRSVSIPEFWRDLSEAERRFYFREFLKMIVIQYNGSTWFVKHLDFVF